MLPLELPLRTHFQLDSGHCFEADFDSTGVGRNDAFAFKAKGGGTGH